MTTKLPIAFRPMEEGDTSFIYSSWLRSYRNSDYALPMSNPIYYASHKEIIENILRTATVTMIVNPDDSDQIYGFGVRDSGITHYIYIKYTFRKLGLVRMLVEEAGLFPDRVNFVTHLPRNFDTWKAKYGLEYTPTLLVGGA